MIGLIPIFLFFFVIVLLSSPEVACGKTIFIVLSSVLSEWTTIMSVSCTSASSEKISPGYYFKNVLQVCEAFSYSYAQVQWFHVN